METSTFNDADLETVDLVALGHVPVEDVLCAGGSELAVLWEIATEAAGARTTGPALRARYRAVASAIVNELTERALAVAA